MTLAALHKSGNEPMHRSKIHFLCVGAMQMVPVITLTDGNPSTWMTLSFLVLVDMVVMAAEEVLLRVVDAVDERLPSVYGELFGDADGGWTGRQPLNAQVVVDYCVIAIVR